MENQETDLTQGLALIDRLSKQDLAPREAEALLADIFTAGGFTVFTERLGPGRKPPRIDFAFIADIDGVRTVVAAEVKYYREPLPPSRLLQFLKSTDSPQWQLDVRKALASMGTSSGDEAFRRIIISTSGFRPSALEAASDWVGQVDLLEPDDLRRWLENAVAARSQPDVYKDVESIIRDAMRGIALAIAYAPETLYQVEWRDLERVLREVFEELQFGTRLTRWAKDGGFDLELRWDHEGKSKTFLVEVKHWITGRVGSKELLHFIRVVARQNATQGLMLATSGYSETVATGVLEADAKLVRLGDSNKIVALCKAYVRARNPIWIPFSDLSTVLFEGTSVIEPTSV